MIIILLIMFVPVLLFSQSIPDKEHMICYIFIGHSNMNGHCSVRDTNHYKGVWWWNDSIGFFCPNDNDLEKFNKESGSVILPFLRAMSLRYPEYGFTGIKIASSCAQAYHRVPGDSRYENLMNRIRKIKDRVTFGGIYLMFGFVESCERPAADSLHRSIPALIKNIRDSIGNPYLPSLVGRYEIMGDTNGWCQYKSNIGLVYDRLNCMESKDYFLKMCPIRYIPKERFCDSHHYDALGYEICANDAAVIIQINNFDRWNK